MDTTKDQFGMAITRYKSGLGPIIKVVTHPLFYHMNVPHLGILVNMSPRNIKYVYNTRFDTKLNTTIMAWGLSGYDRFYRSDITLEFKAEDMNLATIEQVL